VKSASQATTLVAPIDPALHQELLERLTLIEQRQDDNRYFRPRELPDTHFMRFVVIDDRELAPLLVWESNHDGYAADYLESVRVTTPSIDRVFECCAGYPGSADRDAWHAWMTARSCRAPAFYTGYRGIPRKRVLNDAALHAELQRLVDDPLTRAALQGKPDIRGELAKAIATSSTLETEPVADAAVRWTLADLAPIIIGVLALLLGALGASWYAFGFWTTLVALGVVVAAIGAAAVAAVAHLHHLEQTDSAFQTTTPVYDTNDQHRAEDWVAQNEFTSVLDLKPGWFRLAVCFVVLTVIDVAARFYFVNGDLSGITSIHFARWVIIRDTRDMAAIPVGKQRRHRLVFFSNYDGSWESYLGEFVDRAPSGLSAIWSNAVDFPRTTNLTGAGAGDGARDEEAFKQYARNSQITTNVWWPGIPRMTVQNVRENVEIRQQLRAPLSAAEDRSWLLKL
jgi:hypothetical protein